MFEYLMPSLVMRAPAESLIERTNRAIVRRQIDYAKALGTPWGVSESAYNARDLEFTYQYSNFGVPGLGLKRGLGENAVIAPYATALASMVDPQAAARNFERLAATRRARPLRILRGARLHAAPSAGRAEARDRARLHGAPSGHDDRRHRRRLARRRDAGAVPRRAASFRRPSCCCRSACRARSRLRRHGRRSEAGPPGSASWRRRAAGGRPTRMPRLRPRSCSRTAATP